MAIREVRVPELGEGVSSATVINILVAPGDAVSVDQPIVEVENEKAAMEIPSPSAGTVKEIKVELDQIIEVGQVILTLESDGDESDETDEPDPPTPEEEEQEAESEEYLEVPDDAAPKENPEPAIPKEAEDLEAPHGVPHEVAPAGPAVRRLARELGVDVNRIEGSGSKGRISKEDVIAYVRAIVAGKASASAEEGKSSEPSDADTPELPDFGAFGEVEREGLSALRRAATKHTSRSWRWIPHVTQQDKADITALEEQRRKLNEELADDGVHLTVTAIAIRVVAQALRRFPVFNSSLDLNNQEIVYKKYVNIGLAVDTDRGLVNPVIKNAERLSLSDIARQAADLAEKARNRRLTHADMQGQNFSVSNLGGLGTTWFSPIVVWPAVAVLGLGKAEMTPVFDKGEITGRFILPLSVSYDHRVIDGADASRFLRWIAQALEEPLRLVIDQGAGS